MAKIQSIEDLKDYCLRKLGDPVINIEIDPVQAYDRIEEAISFFAERHFNGSEEVYFKHSITRADIDSGFITMPSEYVALLDVLSGSDPLSGEPSFDYQTIIRQGLTDTMVNNLSDSSISEYYISSSHINLIEDMLVPTKAFTYNSITNHLYPKWKITDVGSGQLLLDGSDITTPNWTISNATATTNDAVDPLGTQLADTVTSSAAGAFSISQIIDTKQYVRGKYTTAFSVRNNTYTGTLTMKITDSKGTIVHSEALTPSQLWDKQFITFTYTTAHADDIIVTIEGTALAAGESIEIFNPWVYLNNFVVFHGYKILDATQSVNVYDDRWVKTYATALIKQQWGSNLKKFEGVQMPGGVTLNGQSIYDEATQELEALIEKFSMDYEELPTGGWY